MSNCDGGPPDGLFWGYASGPYLILFTFMNAMIIDWIVTKMISLWFKNILYLYLL